MPCPAPRFPSRFARFRASLRAVGLVVVVAVAGGAPAAAQEPDTLARPTALDSADAVLARLLAEPVAEDAAPLTLDSLRMSPWERLWWGRRGVARAVGLVPSTPGEDVVAVGRLRRRMLTVHQWIGLAGVASMAVTAYGGQQAIEGKSSSLHRASVPVTIGLYSAGATLAFLAPPSRVPGRARRVDSITLHRWLAVGHLTGMVLTPLLAPSNGRWSRRHVHQALGYATLATYAGAALVVTLPR